MGFTDLRLYFQKAVRSAGTMLLVMNAAAACVETCPELPADIDGMKEDEVREEMETGTVTFILASQYPETLTRSVLTEAGIYIYDRNGGLTESSGFDNGRASIELAVGQKYTFCVLAPGIAPAPRIEMMRALSMSVDPEAGPSAIPLSAIGEITVLGDGMRFSIVLKRMYAKVRFSADMTETPGLEITSVRIMQAATSVCPFRESAATATVDGYRASATDLAAVNAGGEAVLYLPENCHGVLLPDNRDSWSKIPENIPEKSGLCSYIEVEGTFSGEDRFNGDVVYRFYLGKDVTSDFSILRNTDNSVRLIPSAEGLGRPSWKIDGGAVYADVPFMAVNYDGDIYYRTMEETGTTGRASADWRDLIRCDGKYVAVGGLGNNGITGVSTNGRVWRFSELSGSGMLYGVAYGGDRFVAVGNGSDVFVSSDALKWMPYDAGYGGSGIAYGNGRFVMVNYAGKILSSEDGTMWDCTEVGGDTRHVVFGNGEFLVTGNGKEAYKSADGRNWTEYVMTRSFSNIYDIRYGNGIYVMNNNSYIFTSSDGIEWTSGGTATFPMGSFDYCDGVFIQSYHKAGTMRIDTSLDGKNWKNIDIVGNFPNPRGICIMDTEQAAAGNEL